MDSMLSKALREFTTGPLNQLIVNVGGQDGVQWEEELKKFLRKEPCWTNGEIAQAMEPKLPQPLLELISGTIAVPSAGGKFVARDKFIKDTGRRAKVKVSYLGGNFTSWFLAGLGKIEDLAVETTLCTHKLKWSSRDAPIIAELGGEEKVETSLSEVFALMSLQPNGEEGVLLTSGYANIFYVRDVNNVLRAVFVYWGGGGWNVGADEASDPDPWDGGDQVFSRN